MYANQQTYAGSHLPFKSDQLILNEPFSSQLPLTEESKEQIRALFQSYPKVRFECDDLFNPSSKYSQNLKKTLFEMCYQQLDLMCQQDVQDVKGLVVLCDDDDQEYLQYVQCIARLPHKVFQATSLHPVKVNQYNSAVLKISEDSQNDPKIKQQPRLPRAPINQVSDSTQWKKKFKLLNDNNKTFQMCDMLRRPASPQHVNTMLRSEDASNVSNEQTTVTSQNFIENDFARYEQITLNEPTLLVIPRMLLIYCMVLHNTEFTFSHLKGFNFIVITEYSVELLLFDFDIPKQNNVSEYRNLFKVLFRNEDEGMLTNMFQLEKSLTMLKEQIKNQKQLRVVLSFADASVGNEYSINEINSKIKSCLSQFVLKDIKAQLGFDISNGLNVCQYILTTYQWVKYILGDEFDETLKRNNGINVQLTLLALLLSKRRGLCQDEVRSFWITQLKKGGFTAEESLKVYNETKKNKCFW